MAEQWLSIVEYARTYSVSDMTVRRRIKTGKLRAVLREGKYYIPLHEVGPPSFDDEDEIPSRPIAPAKQHQPLSVQRTPIVKAHPAPRSYSEPVQEKPQQTMSAPRHFASVQGHVPSPIRAGLATAQSSMVETQTLLAFCDNALKKLGDAEQKLEEHHRTKVLQLEAQLRAKDLEISHLSQQVEDLQVLVKILERKQGKE